MISGLNCQQDWSPDNCALSSANVPDEPLNAGGLLVVYNEIMNYHNSILLRGCIAAILLLSLWAGSMHDLRYADEIASDELGSSQIVLSMDGDHSDDPREQSMLLSDALSVPFISPQTCYTQQQISIAPPNSLPPPYRPPAKSA
jgi:hypothetical protein